MAIVADRISAEIGLPDKAEVCEKIEIKSKFDSVSQLVNLTIHQKDAPDSQKKLFTLSYDPKTNHYSTENLKELEDQFKTKQIQFEISSTGLQCSIAAPPDDSLQFSLQALGKFSLQSATGKYDLRIEGEAVDISNEVRVESLAVTAEKLTLTSSANIKAEKISLKAQQFQNFGRCFADQLQCTLSSESDKDTYLFRNVGVLHAKKTFVLRSPDHTSQKIQVINEATGALSAGSRLELHRINRLDNHGLMIAEDLYAPPYPDQPPANLLRFENHPTGRVVGLKGIKLSARFMCNRGEIYSQGDLHLLVPVGYIENLGRILSKQAFYLTASKTIQIEGIIYARGKICMRGQKIRVLKGGCVESESDRIELLAVTKQKNAGSIKGPKSITLQGDVLHNQAGAEILSDDTIVLKGGKRLVNAGFVHSAVEVELKAISELLLTEHSVTQAERKVRLEGDSIEQAGSVVSSQKVNLCAFLFEQTHAGSIRSGDELTATIEMLFKNAGSVDVKHRAEIEAHILENTKTGSVCADLVKLRAKTIQNAGLIQAYRKLYLETVFKLTNKAGARLLAEQCLQILSEGSVENQGVAFSDGQLKISAKSIQVGQEAEVSADEVILEGEQQTLAGVLDAQKLVVNTEVFEQLATSVLKAHQIEIQGKRLEVAGEIQSHSLKLAAREVLSILKTGLLATKQDLTLFSDWLAENSGKVLAKKAMVQAKTFVNAGEFQISEALIFKIEQAFYNYATGNILKTELIKILVGCKEVESKESSEKIVLTETPFGIAHNMGVISAKDTLKIASKNALYNFLSGKLSAEHAVELVTGELTQAGLIKGAMVQIDAENMTHSGIIEGETILLHIKGLFYAHQAGQIKSDRLVQIVSRYLRNLGLIQSEKISLASEDFRQAGAVQAESEILINIEEGLLKILQGGGDPEGNVQAFAGILENAGVISTFGKLQIQMKRLVNSGTLKGKEVLLSARARLHNQAGASIDASEILSFLEKSANILNEGDLVSKKILKVVAQKFSHASGRLVADQEMLLEAIDLYLCGDVQASQDLIMLVENEFMYKTATLKADGILALTLLNGDQIRQNIHTPGSLMLSLQDPSTTYQLNTPLMADKDLILTMPGKVVINHLPLKAGQDITIATKGFVNKRSIDGRDVSITAEEAGIEFGGSKEELQARCTTTGDLTLNAPKGQVSHNNSKTEVAGEVKSHSETALIGESAKIVVQGRYESVTQGKTAILGTLEAEDALLSSLCDDVHLQSLKSRSGGGENFNETILSTARVEVRKILEIFSGKNTIFEAAQTHSGLRTHIQALGAILDLPLTLISQRVEHFYHRKSHGTTIDRHYHERGSMHSSGGVYQAEAGGEIYVHGASHQAKDMEYMGQKATIKPAVDHHEHFSHETRKKRAWHGGNKTTVTNRASSTAVTTPVRFKVTENLRISGETGIEVGAIHSTAKKNFFTSKKGQVSFLLGCHAAFSSSMTRSSDMLWQRMSSESMESRTYFESIIPGEIEIQAERVLLQRIQGQTLSFMQNIKKTGAEITFQDLQHYYHREIHAVEGPGIGLAILTTIVVSALTAGSGAAILGPAFAASHGALTAALTAGIQTVCSQAAIALLSNAGDPGKALKSLLSSESLKSVAVAMLSAGLMEKVGGALNVPAGEQLQQAKTGLDKTRMLQNAKLFLAQNCIDSMLRISFSREKFEHAVKQGILNTLVRTLGSEASSVIGANHQAGNLGSIGHKVSHAITGGVCGAVAGGKKGAVAGAAGSVVAELTAGLLKSDDRTFMRKVDGQVRTFEAEQRRPSTREERFKIYQSAVKGLADKAKIISGVVSLFLRQDVSIATQTAAQAVEHNFTPSALGDFDSFEEIYWGRSMGVSSNGREGFQPAEENEEDAQNRNALEMPPVHSKNSGIAAKSKPKSSSYSLGVDPSTVFGLEPLPKKAQRTSEMSPFNSAMNLSELAEDIFVNPNYEDLNLGTRCLGLWQVSGGASQIAVAPATGPFAPALGAIGIDNVVTGLQTVWTGKHQETSLYHVIKGFGKSTGLYGPQAASYIELGVNIGPAIPKALTFAYRPGLGVPKDRARNNFNTSKPDPLKSNSSSQHNAQNVNAQVALTRKMSALEFAQRNASKTETLPDGRVRYYAAERPSKTSGQTRGASYVTEHNPTTGQVRSWMETYDQNGNINRIHPKMIDGQSISGQHYPPTKAELESFTKFSGGPK